MRENAPPQKVAALRRTDGPRASQKRAGKSPKSKVSVLRFKNEVRGPRCCRPTARCLFKVAWEFGKLYVSLRVSTTICRAAFAGTPFVCAVEWPRCMDVGGGVGLY